MLPFYNYSMAIIYRQDLIDDPANKKAFKDKYGIELKVPETWDEYRKQVEFFTKDADGDGKADFFGTVTQAQRGDCISMQWSNYLYAHGGRYVDKDWHPTLNSDAGVAALTDYREFTTKYSPPGSEGFCFDEAFNVMAQGKAYSFVTFNILYSGLQDPTASAVVGKVGIAPNPGGGLNGAWGWAIPKSSPEKEAAWTFIKWIESYDSAKKRALAGGAPTQTKLFTDPDVVAKRPYMPVLQKVLENTQDFVVFSYTTEYVETLGRELNLAATGQKDPKAALDVAAEELAKLAKKDGKLKE
jgi:ABC-type glycerol-3-phosphate transport system substrate-binding protein